MDQFLRLMEMLAGDGPLAGPMFDKLAMEGDPTQFAQGIEELRQSDIYKQGGSMSQGDADLAGADPNVKPLSTLSPESRLSPAPGLGGSLAQPPAPVTSQAPVQPQGPPASMAQSPFGIDMAAINQVPADQIAQAQATTQQATLDAMKDPRISQINPLVPQENEAAEMDAEKMKTALQAWALMQAGQQRFAPPKAGNPSLGSAKLAQALTPQLYGQVPGAGQPAGLAGLFRGGR